MQNAQTNEVIQFATEHQLVSFLLDTLKRVPPYPPTLQEIQPMFLINRHKLIVLLTVLAVTFWAIISHVQAQTEELKDVMTAVMEQLRSPANIISRRKLSRS
ncbi:MAG: hypothetical protein R3D55_09725 [Chloroflexota bacterium]